MLWVDPGLQTLAAPFHPSHPGSSSLLAVYLGLTVELHSTDFELTTSINLDFIIQERATTDPQNEFVIVMKEVKLGGFLVAVVIGSPFHLQLEIFWKSRYQH